MTAKNGVSSRTLTTRYGSLGSLVRVILNVTLPPASVPVEEALNRVNEEC